ncbi:MAG: PspC domain-containing protein [Cyclobacteriaceae bacterium]
MKRNISINISGIIFHVEEDGYQLLRSYLDAITRYFSTYEDSKEITDDIESRIAEIFLKKLSTSKQVITKEDVEVVVATMGSVEDFAAQDYGEEEVYGDSYARPGTHSQTTGNTYAEEPEERRRLYRDTQRKILGGVAAGVAYYFRTDPLWVRLLLIVFMFADAFITFGVLDTITFITYIVFWIVVPGRPDLEQSEKIKKLFRNPDEKVLGGVAGGLAAYFGVDPTVIRLLFVLTIFFGGAGLVIYFVLWIITPEAKTLTDKMQMKGEPVTLTNIESSIKKNFSVGETGEESTLLKAVLFPFRLVAVIFSNLGRAIGPLLEFLGDAARVLFGLFLVLVGGAVLLSLLVSGGILVGLTTIDPYEIGVNIPMDILRESFSRAGLIFALIALVLPALALVISGISVIARRRLVSTAVIWSAVGIWFISLIGMAATVPPVIMDFREEARYTDTETLALSGIPLFRLSELPDYDEPKVDLTIEGYRGDTYELQKTFEARGGTRKRAIENAQMVTYAVMIKDSVVSFPPVYAFKNGAKFRGQELDMILRIPYGQPFMMDRDLTEILRNTLYRYDLRARDLSNNTFVFTENGLTCTTCPDRGNYDSSDPVEDADTLESTRGNNGEETYRLGLSDFESLEVKGPFNVNIHQNEAYSVEVTSGSLPMSRMKADVTNRRLVLYYDGNYQNNRNEVYDVTVNMPELQQTTLTGSASATLEAFSNQKATFDLSGSSRLLAEIAADSVQIIMSGDTQADLTGECQELTADLSGSSQLKAAELSADVVTIDAAAAARAQVQASDRIKAQIDGASQVRYRGKPEIEVNESGRAKIRAQADAS